MIPISRDSIVFQKLLPIAKKLNEIDCDICNQGSNPDLEQESELYMEEAQEICESIGLKAFHQTDPRGVSLYIIDDTMNDTNYTNGMPVYEN